MLNRFDTKAVWLGRGHPYCGDVVSLVQDTPHIIKIGALSQYIAGSCFIHCFDGWNYLSRTFDSIVRGDRSTAVHLGYYAELRAAMSLLASQGMAILNSKHFSVAAPNRAYFLNKATHPIAWQALQEWGKRTGGAEVLLRNIRVDNRSIDEWLGDVHASAIVKTQLTNSWLGAWSIDLEQFSKDQKARNEASYRPQSVSWPGPKPLIPLDESLNPMLALWEGLEPSSLGSAALLDRHLLREALRRAYRVTRGRRPLGPLFDQFLDQLAPYASNALLDFLKARIQPDKHLLLQLAANKARMPANVASRAALLLRLASASGAALLHAAGMTSADIRFWWRPRIDELALWDDAADPPDLTDLWAEVEPHVDDLESWVSSLMAPPTSREACLFVGERVPITQFQRSALWLVANA